MVMVGNVKMVRVILVTQFSTLPMLAQSRFVNFWYCGVMFNDLYLDFCALGLVYLFFVFALAPLHWLLHILLLT